MKLAQKKCNKYVTHWAIELTALNHFLGSHIHNTIRNRAQLLAADALARASVGKSPTYPAGRAS